MKKFLTFAAILNIALATYAQSHFTASLDGSQEVPPNSSPADGSVDFTLSGTTLSIDAGTGSYSGLLGGSTTVTLRAAPPGINGATIFSFTLDSPGSTSGTFSGSGTLTGAAYTNLIAGNLYINLTSQVYPGGEIRGQLEAVPEPATIALTGLGITAFALVYRRVKR